MSRLRFETLLEILFETLPEGPLMDLLWWILALVVVMLFLIGLGIAFAEYNR
jgi:hypothetical protein